MRWFQCLSNKPNELLTKIKSRYTVKFVYYSLEPIRVQMYPAIAGREKEKERERGRVAKENQDGRPMTVINSENKK